MEKIDSWDVHGTGCMRVVLQKGKFRQGFGKSQSVLVKTAERGGGLRSLASIRRVHSIEWIMLGSLALGLARLTGSTSSLSLRVDLRRTYIYMSR